MSGIAVFVAKNCKYFVGRPTLWMFVGGGILWMLASAYVDLLRVYQDPRRASLLWSDHNVAVQDLVHMEVTELFHNFLASAKSLVDHTRRPCRNLYGSGGFLSSAPFRWLSGARVEFLHGDALNSDVPMNVAASSAATGPGEASLYGAFLSVHRSSWLPTVHRGVQDSCRQPDSRRRLSDLWPFSAGAAEIAWR